VPGKEGCVSAIVYRATVEEVSGTDVTLKVLPAKDGEEPIRPTDNFGSTRINVPGAACAEDVGPLLRAFGALIGLEGAVRITVEPDSLDPTCLGVKT
jgi:hypothetical protein